MYNHACSFSFEVISKDFYARDVTAAMLREACINRINRLSDEDLLYQGAVDIWDTFKID